MTLELKWLQMFPRIACLAVLSLYLEGAVFYRDVLPILQQRCQSCHRPGEIGPMPLITYPQTRPWAKAIRQAVRLRRMPPWFADPQIGKFANDASLTEEEIQILSDWAATGARAGKPGEGPAALQWKPGWNIDEPDHVLTAPRPFAIPAKSVIDYQYLIFPAPFSEERWVRAVEIRPSDRSVVHHAVLYVREKGDAWLRNSPRAQFLAPPRGDPDRRTTNDILAIFTPGVSVSRWPPGMAKLIPAGAELVLQVHYTSKSVDAADRMRIGINLFRERPEKRVLTLQMGKDRIRIPPGEKIHFSVSGTLPQDALLLSMFPHMHLRGTAFGYQLAGPDGYLETLLRVKQYDFNWQLTYELAEPRLLRAGTRLMWTGYFDNTANNPRNPDPTAEVAWGEQSWDEMMVGFFDVAVDPTIDKQRFFVREPGR
jgi:hypothetical protein